MKLLITIENYNKAKSRELIPLECEKCNQVFYRAKHHIQARTQRFCSTTCAHETRNLQQDVVCLNCNHTFKKRLYQLIKYPNHFCSSACSATWNNKHKTYGTRRSKLEVYLQQQIEQSYPYLRCLYNDREIIGSELDFYFPTLKLAIELNGIIHYEPIYGLDKLERIQDNDKQKAIRCYELGIEFCTIDSSTCLNITKGQKEKYWSIVHSLIDSIILRNS